MDEDQPYFEAAILHIGTKVRDALFEAFKSGSATLSLTECAVDLTAIPGRAEENQLVLGHVEAVKMIACLWADGFSAGAKYKERSK